MNKEVLETISTALKAKLPILLVGHTGTGKTTVIRELAKTKKKPLVRVSITGDTTVDDLIGKYELQDGNTVWHDGVMTTAVKAGHWLVVDEINMASGDITAAMHSLLDDDNYLNLIQHDHEIVKAHKDFRLFATMNPSHASNYAGTKPNNSAFLSRFGAVVNFEYLNPVQEEQLITERCPKAVNAANPIALFVSIANKLRQAYADQQINYICSTRDILAAAQLVEQGMVSGLAFDTAVAAKAGDESEQILKIATEHVQELKGLQGYFPNRSVSFVTLHEALDDYQAKQRVTVDQQVSRKMAKLKKDYDETIAQRISEVEARELEVSNNAKAIEQRGYERFKSEFLQKLGA